MAKSMKNNRAVKMLKAAEEGGYGVIGVVSVSIFLFSFSWNSC
jgi:fructose-bisphosphate aldolase, class II